MLRILGPSVKSTQDAQSKSGKTTSTKSVSASNKDKTNPSENMHLVPPPYTSVSLPTLDYNIVENMKNTHEKISMYELIKITSQWDILVRALGETSTCQANSSNKGSNKSLGTLAIVLNMLCMEEENSLCPPFLLSFDVFNFNVHNFLVDSSESMNVIPLSIAKTINAQWSKKSVHII